MATTLSGPSAPVNTLAKAPPRTPPDPLGLELRQPASDRWVAILPNPAPGQARYKLQYFTLSGLAGHQPYASPQAAYRAARRQGYTEPDPGALDRLSQTPAWTTAYDTAPAARPLSHAVGQVAKALARLEQDGATVETVTLRRGRVPPRIVVSTPVPALTWRCYVWGCDGRGRYRASRRHWKAARWCGRSVTGHRARYTDGNPSLQRPPTAPILLSHRRSPR